MEYSKHYSVCPRCFAVEYISKSMTTLDNIKEHITTQKYISKSNDLLEEYKIMKEEKCICSFNTDQKVEYLREYGKGLGSSSVIDESSIRNAIRYIEENS